MTLISAAEAIRFNLQGVEFTSVAAPRFGARENAVWRLAIPAGRLSEGPHQLTREEVLIAVAGSATCRIGDDHHEFGVGDAIVIPAFTDFAIGNPNEAPFEAIAVLPVGGRALVPGVAPFIPPWAQ